MSFSSVSGTSATSVSKGIGGLVSGMDTDELVTGMTSDLQNKIDQQLQEKQKIEWQQETYRTLIKGVSEFQSKYFSSTSTNNITKASFFEAFVQNNLSETSKYASLSGSLKNAGSISIEQITQLAETAKYSNQVDVSEKMHGKLGDVTKLSGSNLTFYLDGVTKTIKLDDIHDESDLQNQLNKELEDAFGKRTQYNKDQLAVYKNGLHYMVKDGDAYYKVDKDGNYLGANGNVVSSKDEAAAVAVNNLDDWKFAEKGAVQVKVDNKGLRFQLTDNSSTFAIHSGSGANILGVEDGVLKIDAGTSENKLEIEIGAGLRALSGATLNFTVGGNKQSVTLDDIKSLNDLTKQLNSKLSGVSANVVEGKLILDGKGDKISIDSAKSDVTVLGKKSDGILSPLSVNGKSISTSINGFDKNKDIITNLSGIELSFNVDGTTKTIRLSDVTDTSNLQEQLNAKLQNAFGKGTVTAKVDDKGKITFTSGKEMTIRNFQTNVFSNDSEGIIGINGGTSSKLNLNMSVSDIAGYDKIQASNQRNLTINGIDIEIGVHDTLNTIIQKVNQSDANVTMSYSPMTGKVSLETANTGSTEKIVIGKDGAPSNLEKALFDVGGNVTYTQGKNSKALITVDGKTMQMERASNSISINGMDLQLKSTYNVDNSEAALTFDVTTDVDKVVENIKGFVEDYNAVIKSITDEINTRHDRKYPPLTDAQKEEMSDAQIEKWEAKAREGLLYKDTALSNLVSSLRSSLYQKVDGVPGFFTDCGISTGDYKSNGQLVVNETKLRKVLNENPSMVIDLFTKQSDIEFIAKPTTAADVEDMALRRKESGFMVRFQDVLQQAVGTGTVKGTLLQNAGIENDRTESENTMSKKLDSIEDKVKALQKKLVSARERYWKQFTAMEKYLSQMNQQSASLLSQFGYSGS